jgi:flavin reductase (DIM6/NTAB) family NADH-FMN oxidoreductase RutF
MDRKAKKQVLQMLHNGMFVMTTRSGERSCAATVTWVSQASFRPPLIMAAVRKNSRVYRCLAQSQIAVLNILAQEQLALARKFFLHTPGRDGAFDGERFTDGVTSAPVLQSAPAYVECKVCRIVDNVGDHAVVIMEVVDAQCRRDAQPLSVAESPWKYGG